MRIDPDPRLPARRPLRSTTTLYPVCQHRLSADYANVTTVTTLAGVTRLILIRLLATIAAAP